MGWVNMAGLRSEAAASWLEGGPWLGQGAPFDQLAAGWAMVGGKGADLPGAADAGALGGGVVSMGAPPGMRQGEASPRLKGRRALSDSPVCSTPSKRLRPRNVTQLWEKVAHFVW
jgi:hypothetical protein